jgi:hypothetical protein
MAAFALPGGFGTTAGAHVDDPAANAGGVGLARKKRKARQYMNRTEGFNVFLPAETSDGRNVRRKD